MGVVYSVQARRRRTAALNGRLAVTLILLLPSKGVMEITSQPSSPHSLSPASRSASLGLLNVLPMVWTRYSHFTSSFICRSHFSARFIGNLAAQLAWRAL